jgi:methylenetetrahydrofolate reductase (NADPH)
MKLASIYERQPFALSYELFPPKNAQGEQSLWENLHDLMAFSPSFVTCTYGAGGTTRDKTLDIVTQVKRRYQVPVAAHLTCVGSNQDQLRSFLADAQRRAVDYIVALRGDPPKGQQAFQTAAGGFTYANQLVSLVRGEFPGFGVAVAGYPEKHREAPSWETDLENLKRKVDCGADIVITQLFYDNRDFERFRESCARAGIGVPIIPGIMPITSLGQIKRITELCGAQLPQQLLARLAEQDDPDWQFQVGVEFATRQVAALAAAGARGVHFYVLNKSQATCEVLKGIGRPACMPAPAPKK